MEAPLVARRPRRVWRWLKTPHGIGAAATLTAALVAFGGAWLGARLSADASLEAAKAGLQATSSQISDQHSSADRQKRADVYVSFFKDGQSFVDSSVKLGQCQREAGSEATSVADSHPGPDLCASQGERRDEAARTMYADFAQLYVWGTAEGVESAQGVMSSMGTQDPWSSSNFPHCVGCSPDQASSSEASEAWRGFLSMMCRELPAAGSRVGC